MSSPKKQKMTLYQERFYSDWLLSDKKDRYNLPFIFEITGKVDIQKLKQAATKTVDHYHPGKNYFYNSNSELLIDTPNRNTSPIFNVVNAQEFDENIKDIKKEFCEACCKYVFDLSKPPLIKFDLLEITKNEYLFFVTVHHIVIDASLFSTFFNTLSCHYNSKEVFIDKKQTKMWANYFDQEKKYLENEMATDKKYWLKYLQGSSVITKTSFETPELSDKQGLSQINFALNKRLSRQLERFSDVNHKSIFIILISTFSLLLNKYTNETEIMLSYPTNVREKTTPPLQGCFINSLPMHFVFDENDTFLSLLDRSSFDRKSAKKHSRYPTHKIIHDYRAENHCELEGLLNASFSITSLSENLLNLDKVHSKGGFFGDTELSNFIFMHALTDIDLMIDPSTSPIKCCLHYRGELFNDTLMSNFTDYFLTLLHNCLEKPNSTLSDLSFLPVQETKRLLNQHGKSIKLNPKHTIPYLFNKIAKTRGEDIAISSNKTTISYDELEKKSNQLASTILESTATNKHNSPYIVVHMERDWEFIVTILAILKIKKAYVPIDIQTPIKRIEYILEDCNPCLIVSTSDLSSSLSGLVNKKNIQLLIFREKNNNENKNTDSCFLNNGHINDLSYLIYTSGSTGKPKGAMVNHAGVCNLAIWYNNYFDIKNSSRLSQVASIGFDAFGCEIWPALLNGATVCICDEQTKRDPIRFIRWITEERITLCDVPSSFAEILFECTWPKSIQLKYLKVGGEKTKCLPLTPLPFDIINSYGLTETTIESTFSTIYKANTLTKHKFFAPIGRPIINTKIYILDINMKPVAVGQAGKLYIGGSGLAQGYLNLKHKTEAAFIESPFKKGETLFSTNDVCRWLPNNEIEYIGRSDNQIQLRGHRIELSEIESIFLNHPNIISAFICTNQSKTDKQIHAYIKTVNNQHIDNDKLFQYISQYLPQYMFPSAITVVDQFPFSENGKINIEKLPAPIYPGSQLKEEELTDTEAKIKTTWLDSLPNSSPQKLRKNDSFFHIGGSSLTLMQLMLSLNHKFNIELSAIDLMTHKTIKAQSELIKLKLQQGNRAITKFIHFINKRSPLKIILIPSRGAGSESYEDLKSSFVSPCNLYAIESYNLYCKDDFIDNMAELASYYANIIEENIPEGPYILGGMSFGGNIAFEIARELKRRNKTVSFVFMIDSLNLNEIEINTLAKLDPLTNRILNKKKSFKKLNGKTKSLILKAREIESNIFNTSKHKDLDVNILVLKAMLYSYPDMATPEENKLINKIYTAVKNKHFNGWNLLSKNVSVVEINGTHKDLTQEPYASDVALAILNYANNKDDQ